MSFYRITKLFFLFFLWLNVASSQNFPVKNYTAANELPNNSVRSLLVDSNNTLWIGTENGLVKKENDVFKYFFEEDGLALNSCWAIAEDKNNNLWFGSYGEGISIYDGVNFEVISEKEGLVHNEITKLFVHGDHMYVGTSDGVSMVDVNTFEMLSLKPPSNGDLFRVQDFFEYQDNIYVAIYNYGVYKIEKKNEQASLVRLIDHKTIYSVLKRNDSIYSSNKGFFTKTSLKDYFKEDNSISSCKVGQSIIWDYVETKDDKIFAAAWGIYDSSGGIYEIVDDELISRASDFNIPSDEVISLAYDALFEKLFVGTRDAGMFEVKLNSQIKFSKIPGKNVLGFARTKTSTAVLLDDGIILKNAEEEDKISLAKLKSWQREYITNTRIPLPKYEDAFYELEYGMPAKDIGFYDLKVFNNTYWLNTNIGIFALNENGKLERYLPLHSEEINFTPAGELVETHPYGGARVYRNLDDFEYAHYEQKDAQTPTMVVNSLQHGSKTYFLSVFSGLYIWKNKGFKSYLENGVWKEKKLEHITALEKNLAISNEFGDIFIVNDNASFKILKKIPRAKIQGNSISFLKQYQGTLIIGTEKGLTLYKNDRFVFLDEEQGLKQPLLSADVDQNKLSIGSENGFYIIDLDVVSNAKALVDQVTLKGIYINNDRSPWGQFTNEDEIELPHNKNTILLKLSTNAHPYPHKLTYQYRLNVNDNWSLPSSKPEIFLPFLPANNYNIAVKVLDKSTGLNYKQSLLELAILPPFWKTWWFAMLIMSLILTGVYGIYKIQIKQNKNFEAQKGLIQKRFEETKMEALLAQMNPHFIFNAMNSIQYYIMDSDIDNATVFLGDFSKLIRLNLDHCTRPTILLIEEIEYLQSYIRVENTRFNNKIKVIFETDPQIDVYDVEIPTMLLQTFVENVFVHAFPNSIKNPTLKVSFQLLSERVLQCKIEDNGIGYSADSTNKLHKSKGVTLVKERLALLGYEVEKAVKINYKKNKGTTVIITLEV